MHRNFNAKRKRGTGMKATIYCKPTSQGIHSFYLVLGTDEFFLFNQSYRKGVEEYYGKGVHLDEARKYSKAHRDAAIMRTMDKIPMYVRYIEKEYDVIVLNNTKKNSINKYKMRCA